MDKKTITESLRQLAADDKKRSNTARLRDVIDEIESTLAAGVSRAEVVKVLAEQGLQMTIYSFDSALRRIRQQRKENVNIYQSHKEPKKNTTEPQAEIKAPSTNPRDLDEIIASKPDMAALAKYAKRNK